jgi:predicted RNase H-like nuclease
MKRKKNVFQNSSKSTRQRKQIYSSHDPTNNAAKAGPYQLGVHAFLGGMVSWKSQ